MACPFCNLAGLADRLFYDDGQWVAFLAAPSYTPGHTILAAKPSSSRCPKRMDRRTLKGVDAALPLVVAVLKARYGIPDVLVSSLRGLVSHVHFHLIPRGNVDEQTWRNVQGLKKGRLFQFLGYLEVKGLAGAEQERLDRGWDEGRQRRAVTRSLQPDIRRLRKLTGWTGR